MFATVLSKNKKLKRDKDIKRKSQSYTLLTHLKAYRKWSRIQLAVADTKSLQESMRLQRKGAICASL